MEDDTRPVLLEDLPHLRAVLDVTDDRGDGAETALVDELPLDLEQRRLRVVDEHELRGGREPGHLAAELRADGATGPGHHHDLVAQVIRDRVEVDLHGLTAENVLDLDGTQAARRGRNRRRRARPGWAAS